MPRYVAFLRALNVGGRFCRMADLRACLAEAGLADVETYIQTGNVALSTRSRSRARVESHLEQTVAAACGFEVPAVVLTPAELRGVYDDATALTSPLPGQPRRYVCFLKSEPGPEASSRVDGWDVDAERALVRGRVVHIWLDKPAHEARLTNARLERELGVATTRDLRVVAAVSERWGG